MQLDMRVNGTTILTGLAGNPVAHTVSPVLQNSLFSAMGINGIYLPLKVPAGSLDKAVSGLKTVGFTGFNVTIPYKSEIIDLVDEISEDVRMLGAANTVKIVNGRLYAYNTDAEGFSRAFEEQSGTGFENKAVCILGAGGTARALSVKIAMKGAGSVAIINRTEERAIELASHVNKTMSAMGRAAKVATSAAAGSEKALRLLKECDVIVNTTSVGMHPDIGSSPLGKEFEFRSRQIVYDTIYNPSRTEMLKNAGACGCITVNGAGMLFHQGVRAFEIWMDTIVPKTIMNELYVKFLNYLDK